MTTHIMHLGILTAREFMLDMPCLCGYVIPHLSLLRDEHNAFFRDSWRHWENVKEEVSCDGCILMLLTLEE